MHHYDVQNLNARIYSGFDWTRFIASFSMLIKFRKREFSFTAMDVQCVQEIVTILAHARAHHVHTGFWIRSVWFLINLLWLTLYFSLNGKVRVHICRVIPEIEIYLLYLASVVGLVFLSQEKLLLSFGFVFLNWKQSSYWLPFSFSGCASHWVMLVSNNLPKKRSVSTQRWLTLKWNTVGLRRLRWIEPDTASTFCVKWQQSISAKYSFWAIICLLRFFFSCWAFTNLNNKLMRAEQIWASQISGINFICISQWN